MYAKSLQLCPTLCDSMDCSLPGFSVHGILQARTLEWVAIAFSNIYVCIYIYIYTHTYTYTYGFPGGSDSNESACNARDPVLIPGSGRSPGEGNSKPFQYSCLENSMERGAWWATGHGVTKSWI